jgi:hypothetical protein
VDNVPGGPSDPERATHHQAGDDPRLDLRVSHDDREYVAEQLRRAAGEGRLELEELEERLERGFAAKTYRDLQPLLADLPGGSGVPATTPPPAERFPTTVGGTPTVTRSQAIFGDQRREGRWVVPGYYTATAVMGSVRLDLREATFEQREVTISCSVFMGDVKIRVGPDVSVVDQVTTILAETKLRSSRDLPPPPPGGPVLRVAGTAVFGDVTVERLAPGERRVRRWRRGQGTS